MIKIVEISINSCSQCTYLYHRFDDEENLYCAKTNRKVADFPDDYDFCIDTSNERIRDLIIINHNCDFPDWCPLKDE